jgi:hypothetical protein
MLLGVTLLQTRQQIALHLLYKGVSEVQPSRAPLTFWLREAPTSLTLNNCTFCPHRIYVFCKQRFMPLTA